MEIRVVPASEATALYIAARLRFSDRLELEAWSGRQPRTALLRSLALSDPDMRWAALWQDRPVATWGVAYSWDDVGTAWFLGTDNLRLVPKRDFWALSREYVDRMQSRYAELFNYVDVRNHISRRWLERLGFTPGPTKSAPASGKPFTKYTRRRSNV